MAMKKLKVLAALVCSAGLVFGSVSPAMADAVKVVSLGNDLTQEQKNTMLRYFKINQNEAKIILVTNQDERNHLLGYVPESQIGTRTLSCAYVRPTEYGGIKVRTANLNWVTCNMIASSLSTAGVKNCEVVAACPIEVSGTGALTGVQMAYEQATGQQLDPVKKKLAAQEVVVTERYATDVGKKAATNVVNKAKIDIIQNNITNNNEIYNTVVNIAQQNNYNITVEQAEEITDLLQKISDQGYDYEDVKDTLESVDGNLDDTKENDEINNDTLDSDEDSILDAVDPEEIGEDIIQDSTDDPSLAEETGISDEVNMSEDDMNFEFDENLVNETIDELGSEEPINDLADGGLGEAPPVDGEEYIDIEPGTEQILVDPEMDVEGSEINAEDPSAQIPGAFPEGGNVEGLPENQENPSAGNVMTAETLNTDMLSEQARSQFVKLQAFCKAEFEGDYSQLNAAVGDDTYNYNYASVILDPATGQAISKAIQTGYYNILMGTTPYSPDGTEQFMNNELNSVNQYLKQFFGIQGGMADPTLYNLSDADKATLYNDSIRFFSNVYGEMQTNDMGMTANQGEVPVDNIDNMGDGQVSNYGYDDSYQDSYQSYYMPIGTGTALDDYDYY